jgi:glycine cleavage system H protein
MSDTPNAESFTFAMGEFEAEFPRDRQYAKNHMWALRLDAADAAEPAASANARWRFGLSAYAVRLLQDVYFLDWEVEPPAALAARQMIGVIESKKAESELYSPAAGELTAINESVLDDPSLINAAPYAAGWLIELELQPEQDTVLLSPDQYAEHLEEAWKVAQRTIKGQANF